MVDALRRVLEADDRIAYALLFGSHARGRAHPRSDIDVAIALRPGAKLAPLELGDLIGRLEAAAGRPIDLVLMDEAPCALAYRIFRDGIVIIEREHSVLVERKARAFLEYFDFRPIEELCARGVLAAAARGR